MFEAFWQVSVTKDAEFALFAGSYNLHAALNYEHKSLRGGASQFPTGFEFSGVLGESCTQGRTDMHDSDALAHACWGVRAKGTPGSRGWMGLVRLWLRSRCVPGFSFAELRA